MFFSTAFLEIMRSPQLQMGDSPLDLSEIRQKLRAAVAKKHFSKPINDNILFYLVQTMLIIT